MYRVKNTKTIPRPRRKHSYNYKKCARCNKEFGRDEWKKTQSLVYDTRTDFIAYCEQCAEKENENGL